MKSNTPRQIFSSDLSAQQRELQNNVLLKRFAASRNDQENDRYRPFYHFSPPENGFNDPNGLCYWQGKWHLFYQGQPEEGRGHWGHAISEDLIHWNDLPYALYPESEENCFSGTCFVEENRVLAAYYGHKGEAGLMVAVSEDPLLLNWEVVTGKAVIQNVIMMNLEDLIKFTILVSGRRVIFIMSSAGDGLKESIHLLSRMHIIRLDIRTQPHVAW